MCVEISGLILTLHVCVKLMDTFCAWVCLLCAMVPDMAPVCRMMHMFVLIQYTYMYIVYKWHHIIYIPFHTCDVYFLMCRHVCLPLLWGITCIYCSSPIHVVLLKWLYQLGYIVHVCAIYVLGHAPNNRWNMFVEDYHHSIYSYRTPTCTNTFGHPLYLWWAMYIPSYTLQ